MNVFMNSNLIKKMKDCFDISDKVVSRYNELYYIMLEHCLEDTSIYELYVSDILKLIFDEFDVYNALSYDEINIFLKVIDNSNLDDNMTFFRFENKLKTLKDMHLNIRINKNILNLDIIPDNLEFYIFESLISLIDIEMMKRLKFKLDDIYVNDYESLSFINSMFREFNEIMIYQCFDNSLSEIIYLKCNMDISKIPFINIKNLITFIDNILKLENDVYFKPIDSTMMSFSKIVIDRLVSEEFINNPRSIFNFMALITRLEILIEYIDKEGLYALIDYCNEINISNDFGIENIVNVIKKRIK